MTFVYCDSFFLILHGNKRGKKEKTRGMLLFIDDVEWIYDCVCAVWHAGN